MAGYFDSSFILAAVLGQHQTAGCSRIWAGEPVRVSSILLNSECLISLRRIAVSQGLCAGWVQERMRACEPFLAAIVLKYVDQDVDDIIPREERLAGCRTLDAIHLATALHFQPHLDEPLRICSLDVRLRAVAFQVGFEVLPGAL